MSRETGEMTAPYDAVAPYFDRVYGAAYGGRQVDAEIVARVCEVFNPSTSSLLDLGSGTGSVASILSNRLRLNDVAGVEQSQGLIDVASEKLPDAEFVQGDITNFNMGREFDAVTCLFDTINHVRTEEGWQRVFEGAAEHLKPGGVFMFDMVTKQGFDAVINGANHTWRFDGGKTTDQWEALGNDEYEGRLEIVDDADPDNPTVLSVTEKTFEESTVVASLNKVLDTKRTYDYHAMREHVLGEIYRDFDVTDQTGRIMVVAQKPLEPVSF